MGNKHRALVAALGVVMLVSSVLSFPPAPPWVCTIGWTGMQAAREPYVYTNADGTLRVSPQLGTPAPISRVSLRLKSELEAGPDSRVTVSIARPSALSPGAEGTELSPALLRAAVRNYIMTDAGFPVWWLAARKTAKLEWDQPSTISE
jgi:hypothetical protein